MLPCPHAGASARACALIQNCAGVDYTPEVIKDILQSGIHEPDVRREVLGTSGIEEKSIHEIIWIVEAKEAARDAASSIRPATAVVASSSYKNASKLEAGSRPQQPPR